MLITGSKIYFQEFAMFENWFWVRGYLEVGIGEINASKV